MTDQPVDIAGPLRQLIGRLGFHYESVTELRIKPGGVSVFMVKRGDDGKIEIDEHARTPVYVSHSTKVTT